MLTQKVHCLYYSSPYCFHLNKARWPLSSCLLSTSTSSLCMFSQDSDDPRLCCFLTLLAPWNQDSICLSQLSSLLGKLVFFSPCISLWMSGNLWLWFSTQNKQDINRIQQKRWDYKHHLQSTTHVGVYKWLNFIQTLHREATKTAHK